jgi:heterotetrameric sarcosine oxidase gamma subunit
MKGSPLKRSSLYPSAVAAGAKFAIDADWQVAQVYTSAAAEVALARSGVGLADQTARGRIAVEGREAGALLGVKLAIGGGAVLGKGRVYCLRRDHFFISTPPGAQEEVLEGLRAQVAGRHLTLTDLTHGRVELQLVGWAGPAVLGQLCGLDLTHFPDGEARQGSVAKTAQLILRRDLGGLPAFSLIGARSLGAYLWEAFLEAGRNWGIAPIGQAALRALGDID